MKLAPILAAAAAAVLVASVVQAQPNPGNGPVNGYQPLMPMGVNETPHPGFSRGPAMDEVTQRQAAAGLKVAVPQMHLACAADRESLCADKGSDVAADRCLRYHRLKLSASCKQAVDRVTLAAQGRL